MGSFASTSSTPVPANVLPCRPDSISFSASEEPIFSDPATEKAINEAAGLIKDHDVVVFPTETVYGLGADALHATASARIFSTKGRPADNPLIVHVSSQTMLSTLLPSTPASSYTPSPAYAALMRAFWPGPLTMLFPAPSHIPSVITAGQSTVAVRMPSHPVARALIARANTPVAAPSANTSGRPSPTRASHVAADLGASGKLKLILEGGACDVGLESTVIDGLREDGNIRVLRPGGVTVEDIESVLSENGIDGVKVLVHRRDYADEQQEQAPQTPGMKYRHYAPGVPVQLVHRARPGQDDEDTVSAEAFLLSLEDGSEGKTKIGLMACDDSPLLVLTSSSPSIEWVHFPLGPTSEPGTAAARLFDGLHTLDAQDVSKIVAEALVEEKEGLAFMNRIGKAAGTGGRIWLRL
ncbi:translation factor [Peniophora sp. CONT]|nr:translation factor [Peniophora sp. CONT]